MQRDREIQFGHVSLSKRLSIATRPRVTTQKSLSTEQRLLNNFLNVTPATWGEGKGYEKIFFGRVLDEKELYHLAGAIGSAALKLKLLETDREGLQINVVTPYVASQQRLILKDPTGSVFIKNDGIRVSDHAPRGYGLCSVAMQVMQGRKLGIDRVELTSAGKGSAIKGRTDKPLNDSGYYAWPRMGFEASLSDEQKKALPQQFAGSETVQDIFAFGQEGADYWRANGAGCKMVFDLKEGSRSVRALRSYLKQKGLLIGI